MPEENNNLSAAEEMLESISLEAKEAIDVDISKTVDDEAAAAANNGKEEIVIPDPNEGNNDDNTDKSIWERNGFDDEESFSQHYKDLNETSSTYEQEKATWEVQQKELEDNLTKEKEASQFYVADDDYARLSILKAKDPDSHEFYRDLVLMGDEVDANYLLGSDLAAQMPNLSDEQIQMMINKQYGLDDEPDDFANDQERDEWTLTREVAEAKMQRDAQIILDKHMDEFNDIELPNSKPASEEELNLHKVDAQKAWGEYYSPLVERAGKVSINVKVDDKTTVPVEVGLTPELQKEYEKMMSDYVFEHGITVTQENANELMNVLRDSMISAQLPTIVNTAVEKALEQRDGFWEKKLGLSGQSGQKPSQGEGKTNDADAEFERMMREMQG